MYFQKPVEGFSFLRVVCPEPALSLAAASPRVGIPPRGHRGTCRLAPSGSRPRGWALGGHPRRFKLCPRQTSVLGVLTGHLGRRLGSPKPSAPLSQRQLPSGTPASLLSLGCLWPRAPLLAACFPLSECVREPPGHRRRAIKCVL